MAPVLLPEGRILSDAGGKPWWQGAGGDAWPVDIVPADPVYGMELTQAAALWDGARLSLLSAQTDWGRVSFDA